MSRKLLLILAIIGLLIPGAIAGHFIDPTQCTFNSVTPLTAEQEQSLWGFSPTDIWASSRDSGAPNTGTISHYDGATWSTFQTEGTRDLFQIWGIASNDIWVGGTPFTTTTGPYHYTGTTFATTTVATSQTRSFRDFWGSASNNVWSVINTNQAVSGNHVYKWDGAQWALDPTGPNTFGLFAVWGFSGSDVWVSGGSGVAGTGTAEIWHWNGAAWSNSLTVTNTAYTFQFLHGDSPTNIWVSAGATGENSGAYHYNGSTWTFVAGPTIAGTSRTLNGAFSLSPTDTWFGISNGQVVHWSGSSYVLENANGNTNAVMSTWASDTGHVWAAGTAGYIAKENCPPIADAGPDQSDPDCTVQLDSTSSDVNGDSLTYQWTQTGGPTVTLSPSATVQDPSFDIPDCHRTGANATFMFDFTADDGQLSSTDSVTVNQGLCESSQEGYFTSSLASPLINLGVVLVVVVFVVVFFATKFKKLGLSFLVAGTLGIGIPTSRAAADLCALSTGSTVADTVALPLFALGLVLAAVGIVFMTLRKTRDY